jgi:hypothetical protein
MTATFHPVAGQVALVEPLDESDQCVTGVIMSAASVAIDVGAAGAEMLVDGADVLVTVFSADALYRLTGVARHDATGVVTVDPVKNVESIQRRRSPRQPVRLSITLVSTAESDPDESRIVGRSTDIATGGLRVETLRPLPKGAAPLAIVAVPHGAPLMLPTRVVYADEADDGCEYRLAFTHLRPTDAERLSVLMAGA